MNSHSLTTAHKRYFQDFLRECNYRNPQAFNADIAHDDEMFHKAIVPGYAKLDDAYMAYMQSGKRMLDTVQQILGHCFGEPGNVSSFLEFAGGYGRFTRHLVAQLGPTKLVTSDIYREAVNWQHERHALTGIYSCPEPLDFALVADFDAIFVGSLFSHLPKPLFLGWLKRLYDMLTPNGVMAFSVHDLHLAEAAGAHREGEFAYARFSESDSLSHDIYGMTYVSENYVREVIAEVCGKEVQVKRFYKGIYENQDLYVIARPHQQSIATLNLSPTPLGGYSSAVINDGTFYGFGWGVSLGAPDLPLEVTLLVDNEPLDGVTCTQEDTAEILKYFPGLRSTPVRFSFQFLVSAFPAGALVKCRLSTAGSQPFDIYFACL